MRTLLGALRKILCIQGSLKRLIGMTIIKLINIIKQYCFVCVELATF